MNTKYIVDRFYASSKSVKICHFNTISIFHSCIKNRFILVELSKKKIDVALNGDQFGDENMIVDDRPFKSTLIYVYSEGVSVDLLQLSGAQTHMGRYVALVLDKLFTFEEITTITKEELVKDQRYLIIEKAVRSRFKLNHEMLRFEWTTLHECILQKRRNELKKKRSSTGNVTVQPAP
ncbi:unnamed protein product [Adineta steineri]|uniref:Uncharacterized protein n=1 Tax=Adineta steineri TaxID=433720 RepID=A0A813MLN5_9BILA|nr:unnamed protein product [Adineta steineri]CAF4123522.1 unnamed protein product [Adineta steineri]